MKIWSVVTEIFNFQYFEVNFIGRSSSILWGVAEIFNSHCFDVIFISSIFNFGLVPWAYFKKLRKIPSVVAEIFNFEYLWSSCIRGHLPSEAVFFSSIFILVWSPELKFKILGRSEHWFLRISSSNILTSSSIGGCLKFKHFYFGLVPWA